MSLTLSSASIRLALIGTVSQTLGGATDSLSLNTSYSDTIDNGTGSGQCNTIVSISGTVTAGTPADINLAALASAGLVDSTTLTLVKAMVIQHQGTVTGRVLQIGDSTGTLTNAWVAPWLAVDGGAKVDMGGAMALNCPDAGYAVDGTHKVLRITSSVGAIPYQVDIIGVS